jgi:hypothetical protein
VARCLREPLLPAESSPAVNRIIADVLRLEKSAQADRELDEVPYPEIDPDAFREFEAIYAERKRQLEESDEDIQADPEALDETDVDADPESDMPWHDGDPSEAPGDGEAGTSEDPGEPEPQVAGRGSSGSSNGSGEAAGAGHHGSSGSATGSGEATGAGHHGSSGSSNGSGQSTGGGHHGLSGSSNGSGQSTGDGHHGRSPGRQNGRGISHVRPTKSGAGASGTGNSKSSSGGGGGQLVSYVEPKPKDAQSRHEQVVRDAIGDAGVSLVCDALAKHYGASRRFVKMADRHEGYDIEVRGLDGSVQELVEVKAKRGAWDLRGVWVSSAQFRKAIDPRPAKRFVLAVVEDVYEPEATIHFVVDPANRVDKFCFDYGWADAADRQVTVPGALPHETTDADGDFDGVVGDLVGAATGAGLPEPDMPWQLNGLVLLAAWPDDRIGIASEDVVQSPELHGWEIRTANDWTASSLIDALRGGR